MTKMCTKCNEDKPLSEYCVRKERASGYASLCRECVRKLGKEYRKTKSGLLKTLYHMQVRNSKARGHDKPLYSSSEFVKKFIDDDIFNELYSNWVDSDYDVYCRPSADRIDNDKGYSFQNINMVTWAENKNNGYADKRSGKIQDKHKEVEQLSLDGKLIATFISIREAWRVTGISHKNISAVCNNYKNRKIAGGFKWKHAK